MAILGYPQVSDGTPLQMIRPKGPRDSFLSYILKFHCAVSREPDSMTLGGKCPCQQDQVNTVVSTISSPTVLVEG